MVHLVSMWIFTMEGIAQGLFNPPFLKGGQGGFPRVTEQLLPGVDSSSATGYCLYVVENSRFCPRAQCHTGETIMHHGGKVP